MNRSVRISAASVLIVVSLVVALAGGVLLRVSRHGLTAHLFLPVSSLRKVPTLSPGGPRSPDRLQPGLRVAVDRDDEASRHGYRASRTGIDVIEPDWPPPFSARWSGYLQVLEAGLYRFRIHGSHDVVLALDGRTLGGFHAPWFLRENTLTDVFPVRLEPGFYALSVEQHARSRVRPTGDLSVEWALGGWDWQPIPPRQLWSAPNPTGWTGALPQRHIASDAPESRSLVHLTGLPMAGLDFVNNHAFYAAFADRWDFSRFRRMSHFPGYEVLWRGRIQVTERKVHRLVVETEAAVELRIDDRAERSAAATGGLTLETELEPGWHDLSLSFVTPWPDSTLGLSWDGEGAAMRPISAGRLRPSALDARWFAPRRHLAWVILGLATVGLSIGLLWLGRDKALVASQVMDGLYRGRYALALILIMVAGLGLRAYRYNEVPHLLLSSDEHHNARKGWHMLHGEGLRAWTPVRFLEYYEPEQIERVEWADLRLARVRPNFDRPPLFPLVLGIFDTFLGPTDTVWSLGPARIRVFPILLSILSIPLVAALTRRIYGTRGAALLAALLFAAVPSIVLNHRQAKSDMLLVFLLLLALLAAFRHLDTGKRSWLWAAAVAAGLAGWAKEFGVVGAAIVPYVWLRRRRWRDGLTVAAVALSIFGLYFVWGSLVDFDVFWDIVRGQGSQASAFDAGWRFMTESRLVHLPLSFAIGWTLWLWLAVAYASPRDELPTLAAVSFLLVISSLVRIDWIFGWYWVPIFPFLCMAGGVYLYDMVRRPDLVRGSLFVLTALFMSIHAERAGGPEAQMVTRAAIGVTLIPFAVASFLPSRPVVRAVRVWAVVILLSALTLGAAQLMRYE